VNGSKDECKDLRAISFRFPFVEVQSDAITPDMISGKKVSDQSLP
jgi:hypothetical protein